MSAVDVLAVIDAAVSKLDSENFFADDLIEARAAVAELIEADREYDAACSELSEQENADDDDELYLSAVRRHQWARDRRAAALTNIGAAP